MNTAHTSAMPLYSSLLKIFSFFRILALFFLYSLYFSTFSWLMISSPVLNSFGIIHYASAHFKDKSDIPAALRPEKPEHAPLSGQMTTMMPPSFEYTVESPPVGTMMTSRTFILDFNSSRTMAARSSQLQ